MEYRCICVPEAGIAVGKAVECEAYDLVCGRLVKSENKIPVLGIAIDGHKPGAALAVQINGQWVVQWEDC